MLPPLQAWQRHRSASRSAFAQIPNKTLVYCSEGSPAGFDSAQFTTGVDFTAATFTVYNRLVEFERGGTKVEPGLAEKWDVSPDGKVYTFHLRHGVKFHTTDFFKPTREFNADDVLFTFQRMLDPNQAFRKAYPVSFPYFTDMGLDKLITKVEKVDPYTVKFTLAEPNAPFIQNMAMEFASILSAEYGDQLMKAGKAADINQKPVGTAFIFRSYTKDATIRFDGNPDYWKKGEVKISKLIFSITPDPGVRVQKIKRNECQVMSYPRPADIATLKADSGVDMPSQAGFNLGYLAYNVEHKPVDKLEVRQALDMAINKKAILESVYQGAGGRQRADAADPMVVRQEPEDGAERHREGEGAAREGRLPERFRDHAVGDAGAARVQPERPPDGRDDPGRLGEDRREGEDRHVRVGRVHQARALG